jgi:carboxymethylenebutenolidase
VTELHLPLFTVTPADGAARPGIIVVHEGNGITPQVIRLAERLAREGYVVTVPDFFFRQGGPEAGEMRALIYSVTPEDRLADFATAIAHLRALGATSIGVTGFCMGGTFAYAAATSARTLGVDATVSFYGAGIVRQLGELQCPAVIFYGGIDRWISPEDIEVVREHHRDAVVIYPDARHGFMRDGSGDWSEPAATDAWDRLLAHFRAHLTSPETT